MSNWIASMPPAVLLIVKATLLLAGAAAINGTLRDRLSAAQRHLLWAATLVSLLLLPIGSALLPSWTLASRDPTVAPVWQMHATEATPARSAQQGPTPTRTSSLDGSAVAAAGMSALDDDGAADGRVSLKASLLLLYVAGVLVMLARLLVQSFAVRRLEDAASPETAPQWTRLLDEQRATLGVTCAVRLLRGDAGTMPMTWGLRASTILMPNDAEGWSLDRRRAVLLHELAHVARRDCLLQTMAAVVQALYWFHPGVWLASKRMRVERELACDDVVLGAGLSPRSYASELLELARSTQASPVNALALAFHAPSLLEQRMHSILDGARRRAAPRRATVVVSAILMGVLLTGVSSAQPGQGSAATTLKEELRIGGATPELRFTDVDNIVVGRDGAIFVSDSGGRRLRLYDAGGKFVRQVGSRGEGQGQFRTVIGMVVTPRGELAVYDVFTKRITFFDAAGIFVRSMPSQVGGNWTGNDFHVDRDGNLYVFGIRYSGEGRTPTAAERAKSQRFYLKLSPMGMILDTVDIPNSTAPAARGGFVIMTPEAYLVPFSNSQVYDLAPSGHLVLGYTGDYVFDIGQDSGRSIPVTRAFTPLALGAEERAEWEGRAEFYSKRGGSRSASYGTIIPDRKPAFRDIEVGADGRIWVHRYSEATKRPLSRPPSDTLPPPLTWREVPTFDVFEADGTFFGTVILPENTRVFARSGSQLWSVQVNADKESFVVRYRMQ